MLHISGVSIICEHRTMPWPSWLPFSSQRPDRASGKRAEDDKTLSEKVAGSWETSLNRIDYTHYTSTQTITISAITTLTTLALLRLYKTYLRRIPTVDYLKPGLFRRRSIYGYVTRVGDGDNFHLFHTPGGRLMGWGWLPGRKVQRLKSKELKNRTVHVRIAGVDAPEAAHFGRPSQPYSQEALDWLKGTVLHQYVRAYPYSRDQYERVVSSVFKRKWVFFKSDVGLNMIKQGMATVYEAKFGSEFGGQEAKYRAAESKAKQKGIGMWQSGIWDRLTGKAKAPETPREYKKRMEANAK